MEYQRERDTLSVTVTELAGYAYGVARPLAYTEKYGFKRAFDAEAPVVMPSHEEQFPNKTEPAPNDEATADPHSEDPTQLGKRYHVNRATDRLVENHSSANQTLAGKLLGLDTTTAAAEVELAWVGTIDGMSVELHGRADSISFDGTLHTVEEVKTISSFQNNPNPFTVPSHFAQAMCYAFLLCQTSAVDRVAVQITFVRRADGAKRCWRAVFGFSLLEALVERLFRRAMPFFRIQKERLTLRLDELKSLPFPYPTIRPGQEDFIKEAFRTIYHKKRLFVSAPCGIGKTMSSLYPAFRAIGQGKCDRIFYATAKTITGKAALDAAQTLSAHAPHMRAMLLLAKELQCPMGKLEGESSMALKCPICTCRRDIGWDNTFRPVAAREADALLELLTGGTIYTPEQIKAVAAKHEVCPHELALALSESCDLIVCDYNYLFDDTMRLRRYFKDPNRRERYVFCIDEAHNLPDRAREMYSATLNYEDIERLRAVKDKCFPEDAKFEEALCSVEKWFAVLFRQCEREASLVTVGKTEKKLGYVRSTEIPISITKRFGRLNSVLWQHIKNRHEFAGTLVPYRQTIAKFCQAAAVADDRFCFFASSETPTSAATVTDAVVANEEPVADATAEETALPELFQHKMTVQILCLDPGERLNAMLKSAKASIFFSATLSPIEYYQSVTGSKDSVYLDLPSPYEKDNLCLVAYDGASTRFSDRRDSAEDVADVIEQVVEAKMGHYIVYFPSYLYMQSVYRLFRKRCPHIPTVRQKSGMTLFDREQFLRVFESQKYPHLVGFCVLGGMFSEGIDLMGDSLIGAIVVGTGLPGLSPERNIMAEYYQNRTENGQEFAYVYPGMNKVLQAAGRVIRSETDRGVVVLIDDRYNEPGTKLLFPSHWQHIRYTADPYSLSHILDEFWKDE